MENLGWLRRIPFLEAYVMPVVTVPIRSRELSMTESNRDKEPEIPTDSDEIAGDRQTSDESRKKQSARTDDPESREEPNPPHTTKGIFTMPKFGAAGSGGLEIEPGPEKD
jgi:hypothetical protein